MSMSRWQIPTLPRAEESVECNNADAEIAELDPLGGDPGDNRPVVGQGGAIEAAQVQTHRHRVAGADVPRQPLEHPCRAMLSPAGMDSLDGEPVRAERGGDTRGRGAEAERKIGGEPLAHGIDRGPVVDRAATLRARREWPELEVREHGGDRRLAAGVPVGAGTRVADDARRATIDQRDVGI